MGLDKVPVVWYNRVTSRIEKGARDGSVGYPQVG